MKITHHRINIIVPSLSFISNFSKFDLIPTFFSNKGVCLRGGKVFPVNLVSFKKYSIVFSSSRKCQFSLIELQDLNSTDNSNQCWCNAVYKYKSKWSQSKRANLIHSCVQFKTSILFRSSFLFLFMHGVLPLTWHVRWLHF